MHNTKPSNCCINCLTDGLIKNSMFYLHLFFIIFYKKVLKSEPSQSQYYFFSFEYVITLLDLPMNSNILLTIDSKHKYIMTFTLEFNLKFDTIMLYVKLCMYNM